MGSDSRPSLDSFDEASRSFVAALRGHDSVARAVALDEVSGIVDDALARELLRFARDPDGDPEERGRALIALGPALEETSYEEDEDGSLAPPMGPEEWWETPLSADGYREVQEDLRRIYHDGAQPKTVRRRALEAAVRAARPWHKDAVATAWSSGDPEWRVTAVFAMGFLGGFDADIEAAFRGGDPMVRREAMRAAGIAEMEHLAAEILAIAADPTADSEDRIAAVDALGDLQHEDAEEVLEELAGSDDDELAEAAEAALEEIRTWSELDDLAEGGFSLADIENLEGDDDES